MKKRTLKKYNVGGSTAASTGATVSPNVVGTGIGFGAEMVGALIPEKQYTDSEGNDLGSRKSIGESTLEYGAKGAAISAMLGGADFGASAVIGAGYGAVKGWMDKNEMDAAQKEANFKIDQRNMSRRMNTNTNWGNPNLNTSSNMMFAKGGILLNQDDPNANSELELNEQFQLPDGQVGEVDGPSHEAGGIKVNLPEGTRIWSDKLKHNGKTFAKHTKPITSKIAKLEKEIEKNPNNVAKQNSIALLNDQLDYYFNVQEANKQEKEMKRTFRKGGTIPKYKKYPEGGELYNTKRAEELGYKPDATGHLPSVDSETGMWLKSKAHPTAWKELMEYSLNPELQKSLEHPVVNIDGYFGENQLQYLPKKRKGGLVKYADGGKNPYDPFNQSDLYNQWENTNAPIVANTLLPEQTPVVNAKNIFAQGTIDPNNPSARKTLGVKPNEFRSFYENTPNIPKGQPIGSTAGAGMDNLGFTPETPSSNWLKDNSGLVGQLGTAALSAGIQSSRINKLARPRTLNSVRLTDKVANPNYVDYSAERNVIDRTALNVMSDAQRGFGSSAATQAFKNKARLNQLEGTGRSFQAQSNANTGIKNKFLGARSEAAMKEAMINNEIDKYNLENIYGFDTMKAGQKNAITAMLSNTAGQAFGKQTEYKNQLDAANILANQYDPSVINDMIKNGRLKYENGKLVKARNGGTIKKRSFKK